MARGTRGSGTGKTQYNKNKRQQQRKQNKGKMSNIPPTVNSTGESHKDYEIRKRKEQGGYIPPGMTTSSGKPVKSQPGGGKGAGSGRGSGRSSNGNGLSDAEKWALAAEATGELADAAGERAKASKSSLDVTSTKVRSNNASSYNYYPKTMTTTESTSPMVRFDSDYEKEKKRLGLS